MHSFLRSLTYLWPYRARLAVSLACVVVIAVLWAGGLGAILPGAKILIAPEGLHGWAWQSLTDDRLDARVVELSVSTQRRSVDRQFLVDVLVVVQAEKAGRAAAAGLKPGDWIVGIGHSRDAVHVIPAGIVARELAMGKPGDEVHLYVFDPADSATRAARARLGKAGLGPRVLGKVAGWLPEPTTYPQRFPLLLWLLGVGVAITWLRDLLRFIQEYLVESTICRGLMDIRCEAYNTVLHLPVTHFSDKGVTDTMSRFIRDSSELAQGQITLFGKTLVEPAKALASLAMALLLSWQLTLVTMISGPPAVLLIRKLGKRMRRASKRALEGWSRMLGVLEETLSGIRVVKAYTMEGAERRRFFRVNRNLLKQQRRMARIDAATAPSVEAIGVTASMLAFGVAGYWVLNRMYGMNPERFMTLMACMAALFDPVRKLAKVAPRFQRADAAAARVFELLDARREPTRRGAPMLARHTHRIEFRNVSYRYPSGAENALTDVNLSISGAETIGIVGPNGCGKTTLVSLLPRLIEPTQGAVYIDGRNIAQVSLRSLRRQIGLVTQDTVIFNATIGENVAYGLRRPKPEQVIEAAKRAYVDEFVRDLPDGYDTMVGEHGATLSGGQRQRIAIARAILRDPAILIFDEATSQVDGNSERRIHQALEGFMQGRTSIMIAHRLATILSADRVVVMDAGRIVDIGTHQDLLERCRLYAHLYQTQFGNAGGNAQRP